MIVKGVCYLFLGAKKFLFAGKQKKKKKKAMNE